MILGLVIIEVTGLFANDTLPTSPRIPRIVPFELLLFKEACCAFDKCLKIRFFIDEFSSFSLFDDDELLVEFDDLPYGRRKAG
jgi:hypothetical protein